MTSASPDPVEAAVRALARRDLTAHELTERLERRGVPAPEREEAVARLARAGYVDDARFARLRARSLAGHGYGDAAVRADLRRRGVEPELVAQAVAELLPEPERARSLAKELGGGLRAARALVRKGFAPDSVEAAVADTVAQEP